MRLQARNGTSNKSRATCHHSSLSPYTSLYGRAQNKLINLCFTSQGMSFYFFIFFSAHGTAAVFIYERTCASHEGLWRLTHRRATEWACEHLFEMTVIICFWKVSRTTTKRPKTTTERCKATTKRHKMTKKKYRTLA